MANTEAAAHPRLTLQPMRSRRGAGASSLLAAAGYLVGSLFFLLRFHGPALWAFVLADVVVVGLVVVGFRRTYRHARLVLDGDELVFTGMLRNRVISTTTPARVVHAEVDWGASSGRSSRLWILVTAVGRTELALNRDVWDGEQLERVRERLEIPLEVAATPLRPAQLRKRWPGAIPLPLAHPLLMTYTAIAVIAAFVIALRA
jgi:hypothetical protein